MLPTAQTFKTYVASFRQRPWYSQGLHGSGLTLLALIAWPIAMGVSYVLIVRSTLKSPTMRYGLASAMGVASVVAQITWSGWLYQQAQAQTPPSNTNQQSLNSLTLQTPSASGQVAGATTAPQMVSLVDVVRGDQIDVNNQGQAQRVNLLGVAAPNPSKEATPGDCYGDISKQYLQGLIGSQQLQLVSDPVAGDADSQGNLLRYIVLGDGTKLNQQILADGMAKESGQTYEQSVSFIGLAQTAQQAKRGLWGACTTTSASPTPSPSSSPTATPTSSTIPSIVQIVVPTAQPKPTSTPLPPTPTPTPSPAPTSTPTPAPSPTATPTPPDTATPTP